MTTIILRRGLSPIGDWNRIEIDLDGRQVRRGEVVIPLSEWRFRIAAALIGSIPSGAVTPTAELVDAAYGDDPEGGPLTARDTIRKCVSDLRRRLGCIGVAIPASQYGYGWRATILDRPQLPQPATYRRVEVRLSWSGIRNLHTAIAEGRCEDALVILSETFPGQRLMAEAA